MLLRHNSGANDTGLGYDYGMAEHDHAHNHSQEHSSPLREMSARLWIALGISCVLFSVEVAGGIYSNSLALISDAGHLLTDQFAILLGLLGVMQAGRAATSTMSYGYHRMGVLIAVVNALLLAVVAIVIFAEGTRRFFQPLEVESGLMLWVAVAGLAGNAIMVLVLHKHSESSLNMKATFLHVMGDALSSVGIIVGGLLILATGLNWIDPLVSILIAVVITYSAWGIIRSGVRVFLEATPKGLDTNTVSKAIMEIPSVSSVHDLHVWSIAPGMVALSCHVQSNSHTVGETITLREQVHQMLHTKFQISHTTIQMEFSHFESMVAFKGVNPPKDNAPHA